MKSKPLIAILSLAITATAAARPKPPVIPLQQRYTVTTSAQDVESLSAETRLARFVKALQQGRRQKASEFLSSHVGPEARQALIEKRWLPAKVGAKGDFNQLIFWRDIQIHTQRVRGTHRDLVISPRQIPFYLQRHQGRPTGILKVPMVKEQGQWWVDLRPDSNHKG
jgi:hypothetical protein